MNKPITWIIDGYRYWDTLNGNSYYLTRITHVKTGKSEVFDECEGNLRSVLSRMQERRTGDYDTRSHLSPIQDIKCREWRRMLNSDYYAPVNVYERKGKKVTNITERLINQLRQAA